MSVSVVILAAGEGRRLRANRPKAIAELAGKTLITRVLDAVQPLKPRAITIVVNPNDNQIPNAIRNSHHSHSSAPAPVFAFQKRARGTGHAAAQAIPLLPKSGPVLVLFADSPLITTAQLRKLASNPQALSLLTFRPENPAGYGRVVRNAQNKIVDIAEERNAAPQDKKIPEAYSGAMCAPAEWLRRALPRIRPAAKTREIYLTRLPALAFRDGLPVRAVRCAPEEAMGINSPADLARAEAALRKRETEKLLARGVQLADPLRVDIRGAVRAAKGAYVDANVLFVGEVVLGENCRVGQNCVLENCVLGKNVVVHPFSHLREAKLGDGCEVGPFARLRPGTVLAPGAKIGNFVEVKNARVGPEVKAGHLSYLGDAEVGARANIGAGTVTCNYDGRNKSKTKIGEGAFIGSGSQLIAPVEVGDGAYVAAGSVITRDVSPRALAFGRARQIEKKRK